MAHYDTFIVRVWRSIGTDGPQWRARLEHVQQPGTMQFGSLEALLEHLRAVAGSLSAEPSGQVKTVPDSIDLETGHRTLAGKDDPR